MPLYSELSPPATTRKAIPTAPSPTLSRRLARPVTLTTLTAPGWAPLSTPPFGETRSANNTSLSPLYLLPSPLVGEEPKVRVNTPATDKKFTGQELDDTGLYYYNARYYDPTIGRFISADTVIPSPANPLKYTDPSGHDIEIGGRITTRSDRIVH
jgi:RHS repeat-associated protein